MSDKRLRIDQYPIEPKKNKTFFFPLSSHRNFHFAITNKIMSYKRYNQSNNHLQMANKRFTFFLIMKFEVCPLTSLRYQFC